MESNNESLLKESTSKIKKEKKPLRIQLKIQLHIGLAMVIGLCAIMGVTYGVFNSLSKKTTIATMESAINDVENNIISDINNDIAVLMKDCGNIMKQSSLNREYNPTQSYPDDEESYIAKQTSSLVTIAKGRGVTEFTIIRDNGEIKLSSDAYMRSLSNISEFDIEQFSFSESKVVVNDLKYKYIDYKYYAQREAKMKYVFGQLTQNKEDLYVLAGFNEEAYQKYINKSIAKGLASRHIGGDGLLIVTDNEKNVLSSPTNSISERIDININGQNKLNLYTLDNKEYYSYITTFENITFIALMNKSECDLNMNTALKITAISEIAVFIVLYLIVYFAVTSGVIKPLKRVNKSLNIICEGNLDEKVTVFSSSEMRELSAGINLTVDSLKEYMGKEAKLIQKELNFAKEIQLSALPTTFPKTSEFELFATMTTAKEVGGDFYDFYYVDDRHICFLVADVSGKGIPASLFMMQSKTIIKSLIEAKIPVDEALTIANKKLCENNSAQMFVTCWCGILDLDTGVIQFVNAGHNPPLVRKGEKFSYLKSKVNFVLSGIENSKYALQEIKLEKGEQILLYTDGVSEATSSDMSLFGEERLLNTLNRQVSSVKETCYNVLDEIKEFTLDAEQSDDITLLSIRYLGN